MKINPVTSISFGYKSLLKTYRLDGKMPSVKYGIYGGELTKENITLEHLKPHSKGGKTNINNLALSKNVNNWTRSNKPISQFLNKETFEAYCEQFKGLKLPFFNGDNYVKEITKTIERLMRQEK